MSQLNLDSVVYRKSDELLLSPLADELVMMNVNTGDYLGLNNVGTDIWNLIEQPKSIKEICASLQESYEIDLQTCMKETVSFLDRLIENSIVEIK